jgi:hypothetical protein
VLRQLPDEMSSFPAIRLKSLFLVLFGKGRRKNSYTKEMVALLMPSSNSHERENRFSMGKVTPPLDKWRSRWRSRFFPAERHPNRGAWQLLPYSLFAAVLFAGVSSTQIDGYLSVYLVLLAAQLGTVGIYSLMRSLKSKASQDRL